ncbi:MAG: alanine dehydrogenase [Bacteroidetes bacterium]|nr:alanine dehydrogenase [Bacteroidota bacterium]
MAVIGIIREGKKPYDKRVAFTPEQCLEIIEHFPGTEIIVQTSPHRCFSDKDYEDAGIEVTEDLSACDILFGVKEVPVDELIPGKTYFFFSHTIKKQPYNRNLLRTVLAKDIRLVDYETLVWENGSRVAGFGRFAGIVGAHEGFVAWGKKTGQFELKPAWACATYKEMTDQYRQINWKPFTIVVTGNGRVAHGCLEVLKKAGITEVTPDEFLTETFSKPVYVHLVSEDYYAHKDEREWDKADFYRHPESYKSVFIPYAEKCDLMMNAIFWNEKIPRFFSKDEMKSRKFRIKVIADISCDINGSIPATMQDSTIDNPVYGYHPFSESIEAPYLSDTIDIMAVSNLPCELPVDASIAFGDQLLRNVVGELLKKEKSRMIEDATIARDGKLTSKYNYLSDFVA